MDISEYKNIYEHEKTHFFYVSTHRLIIRLIKKWVGKKTNLKILDAGCGTGGLMDQLANVGEVSGIDFSLVAVRFSKARGHRVIRANVEKIPFPPKTFDLLTSIDVIYHKAVGDDLKALSEFKRVLRPNGRLILRVPANKFLMSAHDKHVHTARRYSMTELSTKLQKSGFQIRYISYVHSPLFIASLLRVFIERMLGASDRSGVKNVSNTINKLLLWILNREADMIVSGVKIPFGQGLIIVAQPTK